MARVEEVPAEPLEGDANRLTELNLLLAEAWRGNAFYREKWKRAGLCEEPLFCADDLARYPLTTRAELVRDQRRNPTLGTNLSFPLGEYVRVHRSSGTSGIPLAWADTLESWEWVLERSAALFRMAGVSSMDRVWIAPSHAAGERTGKRSRVFLAPPLGPCVVREGALSLGCVCELGGDGEATLDLWRFLGSGAATLAGNPATMLRMAERLREEGVRPASLDVRKLIFSGDPVECRRLLRRQLAEIWEAEVFERYGLTEAGSVAGECEEHPGGMHVDGSAFIAEVVDLETAETLHGGGRGELVLTTLGRSASPIVRYRTGDVVTLVYSYECGCGRSDAFLAGGITRRRTVKKDEDAAGTGRPLRRNRSAHIAGSSQE